jgi:membrane-bound lytic murein transglycosylase D
VRDYTVRALIAVLLLGLFVAGEARAEFERVPALEPNVRFWRNVYAVWSVNDIAFHDREDLSIVYRVVRVPPRGRPVNGVTRQAAIAKAEKEIVSALDALAKKKPTSAEGLSGVEKEVYESLAKNTRTDKYSRPRALVRAQNGLRERAREGWENLGRYEAGVRAEVSKAGMPQDIIALAYVESLFSLHAVSHAGASGMWQFMPYTGKEYMHLNEVIDERNDPILATEAAMKYLQQSRKVLGEWPLAITSYNYGRTGMLNASKAVGSKDLGIIIDKYRSDKRFGFAVTNYYASFLALLDVIQAPDKFFPGVTQKPAWRFDVVRLPFPVLATQLEQLGAMSAEELRAFNPGLTKKARAGQVALPRGLPLRVPYGKGASLLDKVQGMSFDARKKALHHVREWHKANGKQSVATIAQRYGVSEDDIVAFSGLAKGAVPASGTRLPIPSRQVAYTLFPEARGLAIPDARPLPEGLALVTPVPPPADTGNPTLIARNDGRVQVQVKLLSLRAVSLEDPLPTVDFIAGGDMEPLGAVDFIVGDPGSDAPWGLPAAHLDEVGLFAPPVS